MTLMRFAATISFVCCCQQTVFGQKNDDMVNKKNKLRLLVTTDIGGTDPDDMQSMVHLLVYSDVFDIEGLVSSPWGNGRVSHILDAIDAYEKDYPKLKTWSSYPTPDALRALSKQGAIDVTPSPGYSVSTPGSQHIIECARRSDPRPLYITVWGAIDDVAQALHDAPDIEDKIRIYWIAGPNRQRSADKVPMAATTYMENNFKNLWWIQADQTYRGMFNGGNMTGDLSNSFPSKNVVGHGALGDYYSKISKQDLKMGDTPSILFFLNNDVSDPTKPGWGGAFVRYGNGTNWWRDNTDPALKEGSYNGAKTVNIWREKFLRHWENRMDWVTTANSTTAAIRESKSNKSVSRAIIMFDADHLRIQNLDACNVSCHLDLFTISGQMVMSSLFSSASSSQRILTESLLPGVYVAKIISTSGFNSQVLIKTR